MSKGFSEAYVVPKFKTYAPDDVDKEHPIYKPIIPEATDKRNGGVYLEDLPNGDYDVDAAVAMTPRGLQDLYQGLKLNIDSVSREISGKIPSELLSGGNIEGYYDENNDTFYDINHQAVRGESGKLYIDLDSNIVYRYDENQTPRYIQISSKANINIYVEGTTLYIKTENVQAAKGHYF